MRTRTIEANDLRSGDRIHIEGNSPLVVRSTSKNGERVRCQIAGGGNITFQPGQRVRVVIA